MVEQRYYELLKEHVFKDFKLGSTKTQLLKLPFDSGKED
jgi:hypothetical protein